MGRATGKPVALFFGGCVRGRWAMRIRGFFFLLPCAAMLMGCARRAERIELPNLKIPVDCASEITLLECDARVSPPKCKRARVKYRRGCEQIAVGKR
jgi:hypothetical protein